MVDVAEIQHFLLERGCVGVIRVAAAAGEGCGQCYGQRRGENGWTEVIISPI